MEFKSLDPLLHSELRLGIMSMLIALEEAEFSEIKNQTGASQGNLSIQLKKLQDANYIEIVKTFKNNYPLTTCKITKEGILAFENYVIALKTYIGK